MQIPRTPRQGAMISLVAMVDVLMIMLVFFMVTSTYLDLDMIPVADPAPETAAAPVARDRGGDGTGGGGALMLRIAADGQIVLRGRALAAAELSAHLADAVARDPALQVLVLPSGQAGVQALVTAMDAVAEAGVTRMRILRLEPRP